MAKTAASKLQLLTKHEAARICRVSASQFAVWTREGIFTLVQLGGKSARYYSDEIDVMIEHAWRGLDAAKIAVAEHRAKMGRNKTKTR